MRRNFFNVYVDVFDKKEALSHCTSILQGNETKTLFFVNAHCFNIAQKNSNYLDAVNRADLIYNDGIGMKLGSFLARLKMLGNLNGTDLIPQIIEEAWKQNRSLYLVGSTNDVLNKAKISLEKAFPGILIKGMHHGFFDLENSEYIYNQIKDLKVDLIIVGMGVPRQEIWVDIIKEKIDSAKLIIAGGAILDFMSGKIRRAPRWIRKINMEWLFRFYLEPRRLWNRYMLGNFLFFFHIIKFSISGKYSKIRRKGLND